MMTTTAAVFFYHLLLDTRYDIHDLIPRISI